MTHLGLVSAMGMATKFDVVCYDGDSDLVGRLQAGQLPVSEPDLDDLVRSNAARHRFTSRLEDLARCDVIYVAPDIPTDDEGRSDSRGLLALIEQVTTVLGPNASLIVLSQVDPGFTRRLSSPPLARRFYQVETLIFGRAVERAMKPERYIVGCADPSVPLPQAYRTVLEAFSPNILPMRYESAELAKISINFCLVASVTVANTLAEVCENIGADWSEIAPALKLDRRIGPYAYLSPGLGISGGNLERDLQTVLKIGGAHGTDTGVVQAWLHNSRHRKDWTWRTLKGALGSQKDPRIAVLGLAYKENTHSTKNSPSLQLLAQLRNFAVAVHDPVVPAAVAPFARPAGSAMDCVQDADVVVLATPWPEYRQLDLARLGAAMRGRIMIDPYRLLDGAQAARLGFTYHTLGHPPLKPA
ncbi:MAG: nucleotide sugar dehydrogenase [Hyphomicrobiales bacterium]|nr:MAG: nucleotide sugar dehydrogenase [Hyphomicrobiales bacterium]